MIKRRKTISDIKSPILRKTVVVILLALLPAYLPFAVVWLAITDGVPEAWRAVRIIGRTGEAETIRKAWNGSKHSRMNNSEQKTMETK